MPGQPLAHGLKFQARAVAAQTAEQSTSRWLAGTASVREANEVQLLEFDSERDTLKVTGSHAFQSEVWSLATSPAEPRAFAAVYGESGVSKAAIFELPESDGDVCLSQELAGHKGVLRCVRWHQRNPELLATIEEGFLRIWRAAGDGYQEAGTAAAGASYSFWTASMCRNDEACCVTAGGAGIQVWDLRSMQQSAAREAAHGGTVRDVDVAGQGSPLLASCGDDCRVRIWDLRSFERPLAEPAGHAHWVWQVKFNPAHDQLLATSSSDATVHVLHVPGLAAKPGQPRGAAPRDAMPAAAFDHHEDTVHGQTMKHGEADEGCTETRYEEALHGTAGLAWSAVDPWALASLSYDGRVAVSRVPSQVKYKVLI